jgi:hypothetical protein
MNKDELRGSGWDVVMIDRCTLRLAASGGAHLGFAVKGGRSSGLLGHGVFVVGRGRGPRCTGQPGRPTRGEMVWEKEVSERFEDTARGVFWVRK